MKLQYEKNTWINATIQRFFFQIAMIQALVK